MTLLMKKEFMKSARNTKKIFSQRFEKLSAWKSSWLRSRPKYSWQTWFKRRKKYTALFAKHHKPETDILLKPAANIGAAEIEKARRFSMFENNNPQLGKEIDAKIEDWYNTIYGTAPLRRDGTGRQIEPAIKIRPQSNGKLSTKDGLDLEQSLWKLAERMSEIDNDDTSETGVAALQKSLNNLGAKPPLKTDGQLGSKTTLQTRRQLADNGYLPLMKTLS